MAILNQVPTNIPNTCNSYDNFKSKGCYRFLWNSEYAAAFTDYNQPNHDLSVNQKQQAELFRRLNRSNLSIRVTIAKDNNIAFAYKLMAAAPVPTPAPFPLHGFVKDNPQYTLDDADIPALTRTSPLGRHFHLRQKDWLSKPPGFNSVEDYRWLVATQSFLSARHYEAVQLIALHREVECASVNMLQVSNRNYTVDLIPADIAGLTGSSTMGSTKFYVFLNVNCGFSMPNPPYGQVRQALRYTLYGNESFGVSSDSWVKRFILGRDSKGMSIESPGTITQTSLPELTGLNERQTMAVRTAISFGSTDRSKVTIIVGGPGTGKTEIDARLIQYCQRTGKKILVVASSNYAVDEICERAASRNHRGLFRLKTEAGESFDSLFYTDLFEHDSDEAAGRIDPATIATLGVDDIGQLQELYDLLRDEISRIEADIQARLGNETSTSLGMWIVRRIRHYFGDTYLGTLSRFEEHERRILMTLLTLLMEAQQGSIDLDTESNVEAEKDFRSNFHSQWRLLCKLELSQATGIFCTCQHRRQKSPSMVPA
ncbi:ATP-dependent helicase NAM7 [Exophiala xenobiotica]|nr:ATP-dependent helicase NAM7 [Exophiala xenobiotica]